MEKKKIIKKVWSSSELEEKLSYRFCPPAWAFLPQVRNGTGYLRQTRTADAIAMSLYPSRGLDIHGFEIKIYRGDWLSELKNPEKAEEIAQFCDYWWIVAPKEIINIDEVPHNWGFMIPHGKTLKVVKKAEKLKAQNIDNLFLASILRKTQEIIVPDAKLLRQYEKGILKGKQEMKDLFKFSKEEHDKLQRTVREFEKISGVTIDSWRYDNIGEAVKQVLNGEHTRIKANLKSLLVDAKRIVKSIEENLGKNDKKQT